MAIPMTQIPQNLLVPLFWVEVDNSAANSGGGDNPKTLLAGQKLAAGTATVNEAVQVTSKALASTLTGFGSDLHRMCLRALDQDPLGDLWILPLIDDAAGTEASETFLVSGPATSSGTIHLLLGGRKVTAGVSDGDTASDIRDAIVTAITDSALPLGVTAAATVTAGEFTITYVHKGTTGNSFDVRANYAGQPGGESYPEGVGITAAGNDIEQIPAVLSGGATDPDLSTAIANMGDEPFDYIGHPYPTATVLDAFETELSDRWGALKEVYGHAFTVHRATVGTLSTFGNTRNDPHHTVFGYDLVPTCNAELSAGVTAACARELKADPARPLQTVKLAGFLPPRISHAFSAENQNTLLHDGIATLYRAGSSLRITDAVTTYRENAAGDPDDSYRDLTTLATLQNILRRFKTRITSKYPRVKLVNDGTPIAPGQAAVSPSTIRAEIVSQYIEFERELLVENRAAFIENLVVERNATNPKRLDILYPPDLVQGLGVVAVLAQFRKQYPTEG